MTPAPMSEGELRAILDGCEGVTPGPWTYREETCASCEKLGDHSFYLGEVPSGMHGPFTIERDAAHVARLDPATVASIVTELLALRAPRKEQGAVPVAWRWRWGKMGDIAWRLAAEKPTFPEESHEVQPLYASPNGGREVRDGALADVAAERERQKAVEGWTAEHDDDHVRGEMALAAAAYAVTDWPTGDIASIAKGMLWPWEDKWWKPKDFRSNLVRAAALLVAEIERHDRKEAAIALRAQTHVKGKPE